MSPILISLAAFMAVAALVGAVGFLFKDMGTTKTEDRLNALAGKKNGGDGESRGLLREEAFREGFDGVTGLANRLVMKFGNFTNLFEQADSPITGNSFIAISICCGLGGVVLAMVARSPIPLYPVVGLMFASGPLMWLLLRRRSRFSKFANQLPDALELIGRALRSGHSLASGMRVVVDEMPKPICTEFARVYESQNLGLPLDQALKEMLKRVPNMDLKFFVTSVIIQRQTGGDLAEILDKIGHIIRERFKILGQVQALTGEGRISGVVLMALPIALFFAVYHLNADYIMLLFTDPLGRKMIAVAVVLQVLGAICIKKIVNIKV